MVLAQQTSDPALHWRDEAGGAGQALLRANIQGADLHDRATAQYLVNTIARVLRPEMRSLPPRELPKDDKDVKQLIDGLEDWRQLKARKIESN